MIENPPVDLSTLQKSSETRVVEGITLPWVRREYGTEQPVDGGEVFIDLDTLSDVAEYDDPFASDFGGPIASVPYRAGLALVQAGLAKQRTRGSIYGTPALKDLITRLWGSL